MPDKNDRNGPHAVTLAAPPDSAEQVADAFDSKVDVKALFGDMAARAGFALESVHDATAGVRLAIEQRGLRSMRAMAWLPPFIRDRLKETANLPGSDNFRRWQSGEFAFAMASLRRPA